MSDKTIALLDGDIFAFEIAASAEVAVNWGDGVWSLHSEEDPAIAKLDARINEVAEAIGADQVIVCLSDSTNWRYDVLPSYKSNRSGQRKPLLLNFLKQYIQTEYDCALWENLEADDVLGILATDPDLDGKAVIASKDKDMKTIPCAFYDMNTDELIEIGEAEADRWHLIQSLAGDVVDGYSGCPSVGMGTAATIVDNPFGWEAYEHTFKTGKRAGETETRWRKCEVDSVWDAVLSHFAKAGLGEEEALTQARVARICRYEDYDHTNHKVIPWCPKGNSNE